MKANRQTIPKYIDDCERQYNMQLLAPVKNFLQTCKTNGKLNLNDIEKNTLIKLLHDCINVKVSFHHGHLNNLEILDLAISLFINISDDRADILCTSAGFLR